MGSFFEFDKNIKKVADEACFECKKIFNKIEEVKEYNSQKVLKAFINNRVSESHFNQSTGYGYGDRGRDALDKIFAEIMNSEDALVRQDFASGTHAITVALFALLRPGDTVISASGIPYDTLQGAIGISKNHGSGTLIDFGIKYDQIELTEESKIDLQALKYKLKNNSIKLVILQRSCGYSERESLSINEIEKACKTVKEVSPNTLVFVDNCYGEFVEKLEPCAVGTDLIAGSLIKNPGGAIAPTGGYIAGKSELIEMCACRLTTAATGREIGCNPYGQRELYMGIYMAPMIVAEALKTAVFTALLFEKLGYETSPSFSSERHDIIQKIKMKNEQELIKFCQGIQCASPVDSFLTPEPWDMPGYDNKVIMAAGAFTLGSSIELSADAPLREPYTVFVQGGINFESAKIGILTAANNIMNIN